MNYLPIILFVLVNLYLGSVLSKQFALYSSLELKKSIKTKQSFFSFLLIPFLYFLKDKKLSKDYKIKLFLSEILSVVMNLIFAIAFVLYLEKRMSISSIFIYIFFFLLISFFEYVAVYDLFNFSVNIQPIINMLVMIVIFNVLIFFFKILEESLNINNIFQDFSLGQLSNLVGGILAALLIFIIVKFTKEKGMGEGDIYIALLIGLILGFPLILYSFFLTFIIGLVVGLIYSFKEKKFRELVVPFGPFLTIGFVLTVSLVLLNNFRFLGF